MSTRQYLIDASTRHHVFVQRYIAGQAREAEKQLAKLARSINGVLNSGDIDAYALEDIKELQQTAYQDLSVQILVASQRFLVDETNFVDEIYSKAVKPGLQKDTPEELEKMALETVVPVGGAALSIKAMTQQFTAKKSTQILNLIADSAALGQTNQQITNELYAIQTILHKRQAASLVSTVTNHLAALARQRFFGVNKRMIDRYEWVSTLDGRTTLICMSRDGNVYRVGEGPVPPAHWSCRSTIVGKVKKEFDLDLSIKAKRPSVNEDGAEQVSAKVTYGGWLKSQSKEFVDEALGRERSRLFREGQLTLDKFVDPTGRVYTLDELAQMRPIELADL
jgi:SPP1 gp7 family putative phage head morphogenesis protein